MRQPTHLDEPSRKIGIFEKRICALSAAVRSGAPSPRLSKSAELVRTAALQLIKAKRFIIASHPGSLGAPTNQKEADYLERHRVKLDQQEERWTSLSVEEIVAEYASPEAAPDAS